jgi:cytochrome P450
MVFSTINQSLSFHSSPESFISSRLQDLALSDPDLLPSVAGKSKIVVASILNRKVHIVPSYGLCKDILDVSSSPSLTSLRSSTIIPAITGPSSIENAAQKCLDGDTLVAGPAYSQLMSDWFPRPNLLLEDGRIHAAHKQAWIDQLATFPSDNTPRIRQIAEKHISLLLHPADASSDGRIDLYDKLKSFAWEALLAVFLDLSPSSSRSEFSDVESLQETLLRGQFSLFPVAINARLWQSPRSRGLQARKELQIKLRELTYRQSASCPFLKQGKVSKDDAANHLLLFTSSLAVKALASLLTAFVLNLHLWRDTSSDDQVGGNNGDDKEKASTITLSLAQLIRSQGDPDARARMLRSILLETERLSPPVVGVMRRVQRDILLKTGGTTNSRIYHGVQKNDPASTTTTTSSSSSSSSGGPATLHAVQAGHDIWLYLAGASRDPAIFGDDADLFRFDRYMSSTSTDTNTDSMKHHSQATSSLSSESQSLDGIPCGLAFGAGAKTCLGAALVRHIVLTMGEMMVESGLAIEGVVEDFGVRGWLGWEAGVAAEWLAKGLKQLPVQRPRGPVRVEVRRVSVDG